MELARGEGHDLGVVTVHAKRVVEEETEMPEAGAGEAAAGDEEAGDSGEGESS
jgi:hypothetical protein